jgi:hypothetical protein
MQYMQTWQWLYHSRAAFSWHFIRNVFVKAILLFVTLNVIFVLVDPIPTLGRISAYNVLWHGRERLPYGENPSVAYNLSLYQLDAMFASHVLNGEGRGDGEYRVLMIGDSSVWGILQKPEDTLVGQINRGNFHTEKGLPIKIYNLGYPTMSLVKDLMLLEYGMKYDPDLIVWPVTLESFGKKAQINSALVKNNADTVRELIISSQIDQNIQDSRWVNSDRWDKTIIGQRRNLADMLRLQLYGPAWSITGIDQEYPNDYTPRAIDLEADTTWHGYDEGQLTVEALAFDVITAGINLAGDTPILLINEPIFISQGENSSIRYNFFYPKWAYDLYREQLNILSKANEWRMIDLWDALPDASCYTDSPVHLTPDCSSQLGEMVTRAILQIANTESF